MGLFIAAYVVQADFHRRHLNADAFLIIGVAGLGFTLLLSFALS